MFGYHTEGEGANISPRSILTMRIKKVELPWMDLRFELKAQSHQYYDAWVQKLFPILGNAGKMLKVGIGPRLLETSTGEGAPSRPRVINFLLECGNRQVCCYLGEFGRR